MNGTNQNPNVKNKGTALGLSKALDKLFQIVSINRQCAKDALITSNPKLLWM